MCILYSEVKVLIGDELLCFTSLNFEFFDLKINMTNKSNNEWKDKSLEFVPGAEKAAAVCCPLTPAPPVCSVPSLHPNPLHCSSPVGRLSPIWQDKVPRDTVPMLVGGGGGPMVVLEVDSSRAGSLTRECRFGGFFRQVGFKCAIFQSFHSSSVYLPLISHNIL